MNTSVGTKARKKQLSLSTPRAAPPVPAAASDHQFENALLSLENACMRILESDYADNQDTENLYWQQRLMNIAKPISLALAECNGLRRFHQHYRHRADDESILHPVLADPLDMLAKACEEALKHCQRDLAGMHNARLSKAEYMLESVLQNFLAKYGEFKE